MMTKLTEIKPDFKQKLRSRFARARSFLDLSAICPHCNQMAQFKPIASNLINGRFNATRHLASRCAIHIGKCTSCHGAVIGIDENDRTQLLWPNETWRDKAPAGVDQRALDDYREAVAVLPKSAQCAAFLARRSLCRVILMGLKIDHGKLFFQLEAAVQHEKLSEVTRTAIGNMLRNHIGGPPLDVALEMKPRGDPSLYVLPMGQNEARFTLRTLEMLMHDVYAGNAQQEEFAPLRAAG